MKQQSLSVSIPEPCHEKWSDMTPAEKGRHCKSCQKTVVDFTAMPKVKIAEFVTENKGGLCGRFSSDQLNVELIPPKPTKSWLKYAAIFMGLIPAVGFGQEITKPVMPQNPTHQSPIRGKIKLDSHIQKHSQEKNVEVSGVVVDRHNGEPIAFARVVIFKNGKSIQTVETNFEGEFKAKIPTNAHLVISYVGYQEKRISYQKITSQKGLRIKLQESFALMGMVIVEKPKVKENLQEEIEKLEIKVPEQELMMEEFITGDIEIVPPPPPPQLPEDIMIGEYVTEEKDPKFEEPIEEEPVQMVNLPEVEIFGTKPILAVAVTGGIQIIREEEEEKKESWLKRLWNKFESWVATSHNEAQKNRTTLSETNAEELATHETIYKTVSFPVNTDTHKVEPISKQPQVKIFPNPSDGIFNIQLPEGIENFVIEISNMQHEVIVRSDQHSFDGSMDLSMYPAGSYVVAIVAGGELINSQVIIKI